MAGILPAPIRRNQDVLTDLGMLAVAILAGTACVVLIVIGTCTYLYSAITGQWLPADKWVWAGVPPVCGVLTMVATALMDDAPAAPWQWGQDADAETAAHGPLTALHTQFVTQSEQLDKSTAAPRRSWLEAAGLLVSGIAAAWFSLALGGLATAMLVGCWTSGAPWVLNGLYGLVALLLGLIVQAGANRCDLVLEPIVKFLSSII